MRPAVKVSYPCRVDVIGDASGLTLDVDGARWGTAAPVAGGWQLVAADGRRRTRVPVPTGQLRDRVARIAYEDRKAAARARVAS